jgi:predicted amidohydrolase/GNAT superfamily N-acetyltransferase
MDTIELKEYERRTVLRSLRIEDYDSLVAMHLKCFPGLQPWSRAQIESQLQIFPEGQICIEIDGQLAASSGSLIIEFDPEAAYHNWREVADNGFIRNHKPSGDTLYGIEIMVDPEFRGMKLSRRIYDRRKDLCRERNLAGMIIGGRIPGYHEHADRLSAREYVERVMDKSLHDPVLTAQVANGFTLLGLIPNYVPDDKQSLGYATYLEWRNLDYVRGAKRRFHHVVEPVRLAVVQYQLRTLRNFDEFARQCAFFIDAASTDYRADFIVFPELFTTELLSFVSTTRPGLAARKLAEFTPQYLELFTDLAVKYNINIVGGSQFVVEDDVLYNVAFLFRRDGTLGKQYKIHVTPSERQWWGVSPGKRVEVFDTDCGKIAIVICYDIEFPELVRIAAQKGALIVFVPYNTDTRHGYLRIRNCSLARCVENHIYVAVSGCTGNLPFVENADLHYAQCAVFTPADAEFARDAIGAESQANIETMIIHDVDVELLRRHKLQGDVQNWYDRRRDIYKIVYLEDEQSYEI